MYQSFTMKSGFFGSSSLPVCVHDVRYISKYFVLSVFYSCRYTIAPLLCLSSFVCAHSYIFQLFIYSEYDHLPTILTSLPPPPFPVWSIGGCTPPKFFYFFIFLFFKSHDTINSQYSNRFMEFFHIIILWSLIFNYELSSSYLNKICSIDSITVNIFSIKH